MTTRAACKERVYARRKAALVRLTTGKVPGPAQRKRKKAEDPEARKARVAAEANTLTTILGKTQGDAPRR